MKNIYCHENLIVVNTIWYLITLQPVLVYIYTYTIASLLAQTTVVNNVYLHAMHLAS